MWPDCEIHTITPVTPDVYRQKKKKKTRRKRQFISMHSLCFTEQVAGSLRYSDMDVKEKHSIIALTTLESVSQ